MKRALGIAGILLAAIAAAVACLWWLSKPPAPDAFYAADIPAGAAPGTLLRSEPFVAGVPEGSRGWRILYTTTNRADVAVLASAVVLTPLEGGPHPVIAWSHGTIGVSPACGPSLQGRPFANVPAFDTLLSEGWAYVGSDYAGLGTAGPHPYLEGEGEARSQLDAVRAARSLEGLRLDNRVVVWGHSQGGHAALWAGIIAPRYAPELEIAGVAAAAPATDLPVLLRAAQSTPIGRILSAYVVTAYSAIYADVSFDSEIAGGRRWIARDLADRCLAGTRGIATALIAAAVPDTLLANDPGQGAFGARLRENRPDGAVEAPLLVQQGLADELVLPAIQDAFVAARCAAGQRLEYRTYAGLDHLGLVAPNSPAGPDLVQWTRDRFAGMPQPPGCTGAPS